MRRIFTTVCCLAVVAVLSSGCTESSGGGTGSGGDAGMTWEKLVGQYPFMGNFPKYNGDIEFPQYNDTMGMESVGFFDYKCEESMVSDYYSELTAAGFEGENGIYSKKIGGDEFVFTGGYAAGNFGMVFSCVPED